MTDLYDWAQNAQNKHLKKIHNNFISIKNYSKAFKVTSTPTSNGIEIFINYIGDKDSRKEKWGLIKLEESEYLASRKGYFLHTGEGFTSSNFAFMSDKNAFPEKSFEFSFGIEEINSKKHQIKHLIGSSEDFVLIGRNLLLSILQKFEDSEEKYEYINKIWKK